MTSNLPAIQQKAISLRDFLQGPRIKAALDAAMPKWMSTDRLLRIVYTTSMKNPKILDCTPESILQSIMQCAQLGLEPILGRSYLIPYNNTKYVNGKKEKFLECQFQPGYQGLVDLARRTNTISDVWGFNVYEADVFDLQYGMNRDLHHRPWYMDPVKRKAASPGEIIGAFVVWQLKDGTKHPEFMPIHEIHKRRDVSPAFRWAEFGDPKRGGGQKDSIWHKWPDEMNLKTVVKHSSKLIPASIEFMQAVELDNAVEAGKSQTGMFSDEPDFTLSLPESPPAIEDDKKDDTVVDVGPGEKDWEKTTTPPEFAQMVKDTTGKEYVFISSKDGLAKDLLSAYIEFACGNQAEPMTPHDMMAAVSNKGVFPGFWNGFDSGTWKQHFSGKLPGTPAAEKPPEKEPVKPDEGKKEPAKEQGAGTGNENGHNAFELNWKTNTLKKVGLARFWDTNKKDWEPASDASKIDFKEKWIRCFTDNGVLVKPFPGEFPKQNKYEPADPIDKRESSAMISSQDAKHDGVVTDGKKESVEKIDYQKKFVDIQLTDPEGLIKACEVFGYGAQIVIPMSEDKRKELYDTYLEVKKADGIA